MKYLGSIPNRHHYDVLTLLKFNKDGHDTSDFVNLKEETLTKRGLDPSKWELCWSETTYEYVVYAISKEEKE